ncbi:AbrB/MazE/SpoVT family DNA-binding domain-containing protein [Hyphomonas sp.]|uniref:AbrB/MazE/SpoVT family DNA-binding domain-containing protein n=1 Tax=Hyphomonas sp. TaxID=87 RepID=UPI00391907DD
MSNTEYRITKKGQVTLPKAIREHLGVREGDEVWFEIRADGQVVVRRHMSDAARRDAIEQVRNSADANTGMTTDEYLRFTRGEDWPSADPADYPGRFPGRRGSAA